MAPGFDRVPELYSFTCAEVEVWSCGLAAAHAEARPPTHDSAHTHSTLSQLAALQYAMEAEYQNDRSDCDFGGGSDSDQGYYSD